MAANPFSGIITQAMKDLHKNMISSLLYNDALTFPCTIYYGDTKYEDCVNCIFDSIGNKSSNRFQSGGPIPFPFGGICPMCNGAGKRAVITSEDLRMAVIFEPKKFMNTNTVNIPEEAIQTITFIENAPKLKRAKEIVVLTDVGAYGRYRYVRDSEPLPCGYGQSNFVSCIWRKSG